MTVSEKVNLINENANLALYKLVNSSAENHIFLDFKEKYSKGDEVYTTQSDIEATKLALEEMVMKGLL